MKRFVATCTFPTYWGEAAAVVGVDAMTMDEAEIAISKVVQKYETQFHPVKMFAVIERVTAEKERALSDAEFSWYVRETRGEAHPDDGHRLWWSYWEAACWHGEYYCRDNIKHMAKHF